MIPKSIKHFELPLVHGPLQLQLPLDAKYLGLFVVADQLLIGFLIEAAENPVIEYRRYFVAVSGAALPEYCTLDAYLDGMVIDTMPGNKNAGKLVVHVFEELTLDEDEGEGEQDEEPPTDDDPRHF